MDFLPANASSLVFALHALLSPREATGFGMSNILLCQFSLYFPLDSPDVATSDLI